ncbi:MAG: phage baseplate assembly protein V [Candidatus Competibacteraceae bacterium]
MTDDTKYYGKYRGVVLNNLDPLQTGRLLVQVTDITGLLTSSWAMPCVPIGGIQMGMYAIPPVGSGVWIEFEQGDPDYPVWVGCFWGTAVEVPTLARMVPPPVPGITLQTPLQNGLTISDVPGPTGGIMLKSTSGATIIVNDTGIIIQNGKGASIMLTGPTVNIVGNPVSITAGGALNVVGSPVNVNAGALVVT